MWPERTPSTRDCRELERYVGRCAQTISGAVARSATAHVSGDNRLELELGRQVGTGVDAGKIRSIKRDLMCLQVLLKSYGEELAKLKPVAAESRIIFYYDVRSIPRPWS